eukprot:7234787-Pyramimonas_sp.AAC.1
MEHSLGAMPNVASSSSVIAVSRCDRAQQSCAPMIMYFEGSASASASAGVASAAPPSGTPPDCAVSKLPM